LHSIKKRIYMRKKVSLLALAGVFTVVSPVQADVELA